MCFFSFQKYEKPTPKRMAKDQTLSGLQKFLAWTHTIHPDPHSFNMH